MTPKMEALAYRIWAFANPKGWNVTLKEVAEEMGCGVKTVSAVAMVKDWTRRFRVTTPQEHYANPSPLYDPDFEVPSAD